MDYQFSQRSTTIQPSATLSVSAKAAELRAQGKDIIALSAGEPDFPTPDHIKQAAINAVHDNQTRYTAVDGTPELKQAIIKKLQHDNNLDYQPEEIIASCGAKHSIFNALMALLNTDDEVIIPAPYWVSYPDMVKLCGAKPIIINPLDATSLKPTAEQIQQAITPRTKILMLNSPSNPTGIAFTTKELLAIGEVVRNNKELLVISDEIYEHIYWGTSPLKNLLNICPDLRERFILINGVSKAYAMTGWRIGYTAASAAIVKTMKKIQSQSTSNPCSIAQAASAAALIGDQSCLATMRDAFQQRQVFLIDAIKEIPGIEYQPGDGAFYAFVNCKVAIDQLENINNDIEFCNYMLEQANVALVPGSAFGAPGFVRISFATSLEQLKIALNRIKIALSI